MTGTLLETSWFLLETGWNIFTALTDCLDLCQEGFGLNYRQKRLEKIFLQRWTEAELSPVPPHPALKVTWKTRESAAAERRNDTKGSNSGGKGSKHCGQRWKESRYSGGEKERADRERRGDGGGLLLRMGGGFVKSERLEAHLNSGCVSPALAECYLL